MLLFLITKLNENMLFTFRMREGLSSSPQRRSISASHNKGDEDSSKTSSSSAIRRRHTCAAVEVPRQERLNLIAQKLAHDEKDNKEKAKKMI